MTTAQPLSEAAPDACLDPIEEALSETHALRRLAMLEQIAETGMVLMQRLRRRVERQLEAEEVPACAGMSGEPAGEAPSDNETALVFSRLSRAMRLTFALDARMREELRVREYGPADADDDAASDPDDDPDYAYARSKPNQVALRRAMARNAVNAVMTEAIETTTSEPAEIERLRAGLYERLYESEAYDDIADAGLKQTLIRVCADLDIDPLVVSHWLPQSWAVATIFARPIRPPGVPDRPHRPAYDDAVMGPGPGRRPDG